MKIAICDDNPNDRLNIKQWFTFHRPDIKQDNIIEFSSGGAFLHYISNNSIDIVYLDCQMTGLDGITTAREIRKNSDEIIVILVSNYTEYAVHGYELNVFRYVLKSDFANKAESVFDNALAHIGNSNRKTYWVKYWGKTERIIIDDIVYVESQRHKTEIFLCNNIAFSQYKKLDAVEEDLTGYGFIRCHQSYLVNNRFIRRMGKNTIELENGNFIPVSRERYKTAYDKLSFLLAEVM